MRRKKRSGRNVFRPARADYRAALAFVRWGFFTMRSFIWAAGILALAGSVASAEEAAAPPQTPQPRMQRTQHELNLGGQVVKYTATVGWVILKRSEFGKQDDKPGRTARTPGSSRSRDSATRPTRWTA